jgi:hypothetical protein
MPKPLPTPPTLSELLAGPVVLNLPQTCRALGLSEDQAHERLARGTSPVDPIEPRKRGVPLRFRLADVLAALGFPVPGSLRESAPSLSPSPAGDHGEQAA